MNNRYWIQKLHNGKYWVDYLGMGDETTLTEAEKQLENYGPGHRLVYRRDYVIKVNEP